MLLVRSVAAQLGLTTGRAQTAEDVVQETMVRVWRVSTPCRPTRGRPALVVHRRTPARSLTGFASGRAARRRSRPRWPTEFHR
ncbi:sigma factor [Micromonospora sp. NPDC003944]